MTRLLNCFLSISFHIGWLIAALLLLTGCMGGRIDVQKICPKYPKITLLKQDCYKNLQKFESFICKHTDNKYYVCLDEYNASVLVKDIAELYKCIEVLNEQIDFYNKVILSGQK